MKNSLDSSVIASIRLSSFSRQAVLFLIDREAIVAYSETLRYDEALDLSLQIRKYQ